MYDNPVRDYSTLETTPDRQLQLAQERFRVMLRKTFDRLPSEHQNFLILGGGIKLTHAEIGSIVGCSQRQVYQEMKRARRHLLRNLSEGMKTSGESIENSDRLAALDTVIEEELPAQIQEFFRDRIQRIYQSLNAEQQQSLAPAFFSEKDN
ncbi:MAG: hypothetical protein AAGA60_15675 [Cyanobacteria bacterium P01_E01_bin.42]